MTRTTRTWCGCGSSLPWRTRSSMRPAASCSRRSSRTWTWRTGPSSPPSSAARPGNSARRSAGSGRRSMPGRSTATAGAPWGTCSVRTTTRQPRSTPTAPRSSKSPTTSRRCWGWRRRCGSRTGRTTRWATFAMPCGTTRRTACCSSSTSPTKSALATRTRRSGTASGSRRATPMMSTTAGRWRSCSPGWGGRRTRKGPPARWSRRRGWTGTRP